MNDVLIPAYVFWYGLGVLTGSIAGALGTVLFFYWREDK